MIIPLNGNLGNFGSLVRLAGEDSAAANEDLADATFVVNKEAGHSETAGWDPYEVWRTRVKPVRAADCEDPDEL